MNVTFSGHGVAVPEVVVYFSSPAASGTMEGYDGGEILPLCNSSIGTSGSSVQAYSGVPDGYIFNFGDGNPCYRYQAGANPLILYVQNESWPPSDVLTFPANISVGGVTLTCTAFNEGIDNGDYWSNVYYGTTTGTNSAELSVSIAGGDSTGDVWGNLGTFSFSEELDPSDATFSSLGNLGNDVTALQSAPQYGPPKVLWGSTIVPFAYNLVNGGDVYYDSASNSTVIIDHNYNVTATQPYQTVTGSYYPASYSFNLSTWPSPIAAVSFDEMSFLGPLQGEEVITSGWDPVSIASGWDYNPTEFGPSWFDYTQWEYALFRPDGKAVFVFPISFLTAGEDFSLSNYNGGGAYDAPDSSGILDFTSANPPQSAPDGEWIDAWAPLYVNSTPVYFSGGMDGVGFSSWNFSSSDWSAGCQLSFGSSGPGQIWAWDSNGNYFGTINSSLTGYIGTGWISGTPGPQQGPPCITWYGVTLSFQSTDGNGTDYYSDPNNLYSVEITSSDSVLVSSSAVTASGTFNQGTSQFGFPSGANVSNFAAQELSGELVGIPPGLEMYFNQPGNAQQVELGNGTFLSSSNALIYTFQRPDDGSGVSYGVKFVANSSGTNYLGIRANSMFVVQDNQGSFSSPVYIYKPASGSDFSLDTTENGWPVSNVFPVKVYVNGHYSPIDGATATTSGSGQYPIGRVPYNVYSGRNVLYAGDVSINWSFGSGGFRAAVSGSYASFASITGTWDGNLFYVLPAGLVICASRPPARPTQYPAEISWNGVDLTYNPVASSVSGANPNGASVYYDTAGIGLTATFANDGSCTVTLVDSNGTNYSGTFTSTSGSPGSGTFSSWGTSPGIVSAINNQESGGGNTPVPITSGTGTDIPGDLDIEGNYLTLGTWFTGGSNSVNGLAISYADTQTSGTVSTLRFGATRGSLDWMWSEATRDNKSPQISMMELDPSHRLILHDTTPQNAPSVIIDPTGTSTFTTPVLLTTQGASFPTVTLDPAGPSKFKNGLIVPQQGDIGMGIFTTGTSP
jgi:hypothetical protein